jgi:hypothetical protein
VILYLALWAIAISVIAGLAVLAHAHFWLGMLGFAAYFIGAHFLFKLFGYPRGIFDVP